MLDYISDDRFAHFYVFFDKMVMILVTLKFVCVGFTKFMLYVLCKK